MSRRLLVISYHFPPDGAVGGLRWAGMTRGLAELGWSSWVLTAAAGATGAGATSDAPGVTVVRCPRRKTLNDRYATWRRSDAAAPSEHAVGSAPSVADDTPTQSSALHPLRAAVSSAGVLLTVPDEARGWIMRAAITARALIRRVRPSVVITSGPPHSAHLVGRLACWAGGPARFLDLRDPILSRAYPPFERAKVLSRHVIERVTLRSAEGVLCVTAEAAEELSERFPGLRIAHIPNGVDLSTLPPAADSDTPLPGLSIAHIGSLYLGRDPSVALRAVRLFADRYPAASDGLKLRLIGGMDEGFAAKVAELSGTLALGAHVEVIGAMRRAEALSVLRRSRIALVFAQQQVMQVPAKLYEAAALARDVVVITELHSASGREAARIGAAVVAPDDAEGLARLFERAWHGERLDQRSAESVRAIDYRAIAQRLAGVLEGSVTSAPPVQQQRGAGRG